MPGTIFTAPTSDGRLSAGRVLRREFHGGAHGALIAATPWLGKERPSLDLPALREILILNHHNWKDRPEIFWVHDIMPSDFIHLGKIELSSNDLAASSNSFGGWGSVPLQALLQWRWDHDREALLQDESRLAAEQAKNLSKRAAIGTECLTTLTLDSLVDRTWFPSWKDAESNLPLQKCRTLMASLVSELRAASKLTMGVAKRHLKQSVRDINRLDTEYHFIATIEREDLYEAYEEIMSAAKFPQLVDQIDQWRDW